VEWEQSTFKPQILGASPLRKPAAGSPDQATPEGRPASAHSRLYEQGKAHVAAMEARRAEEEAARLAACTFSPDTTASKASAARMGLVLESAGGEGGGEGGSGAKPAPHERLYAHARERQERMKVQPSALELGCTFAPAISAVSRRLTERMHEPDTADLPRHELLYMDGLQKQHARAAGPSNRQLEMTQDDEVNCTFHPHITALPPKTLIAVPVHDRLFQHARDKQTAAVAAAMGTLAPSQSYVAAASAAGASPRSEAADAAAPFVGSGATGAGAVPASGDGAGSITGGRPGEAVEAIDGKEMFLI
jgi:hypothetical protein